jgi:hypothetical protein
MLRTCAAVIGYAPDSLALRRRRTRMSPLVELLGPLLRLPLNLVGANVESVRKNAMYFAVFAAFVVLAVRELQKLVGCREVVDSPVTSFTLSETCIPSMLYASASSTRRRDSVQGSMLWTPIGASSQRLSHERSGPTSTSQCDEDFFQPSEVLGRYQTSPASAGQLWTARAGGLARSALNRGGTRGWV